MTPARFAEITRRYPRLRLAIVGDYCLDRYLEIDPARREKSIETGLPVHNVGRIRSLPGASGTVLNNLVALGVGTIHCVGFCGDDGEGFELQRALRTLPGVKLDHFITTPERHTFTYTKPLVVTPGEDPRELSRLDLKNWTPTPRPVERRMITAVDSLAGNIDAAIALEQTDLPDTGVITARVRTALAKLGAKVPILADSRRGVGDFRKTILKMNGAEFRHLASLRGTASIAKIQEYAANYARKQQRAVFISLAERGIIGAEADGTTEHVPAFPIRGPLDVVGAGDSVSANLTTALAAGASLREALELAMAGASVVVHKLGTTGTASPAEMRKLLLG